MGGSKRWVYLILSTFILLFLGLIFAWSIFKIPISSVFSTWTESELSLTFTISMVFFCLGGYLGGRLERRMHIRARLLLSALLLVIGFGGVSTINAEMQDTSLLLLYLFYGVLCGAGNGLAYNGIITTMTKWFSDKVGLASGIMLMGFGLGGLILGSAINILVARIGLNGSFRLLALVFLVILILGAMIIQEPKYQTQSHNPDLDSVENFTASEMMRTSRFWFFALWAVSINAGGLLVINSAANISVAYGGSAILGMIVSLFNGFGRIISGSCFDRYGRRVSTLLVLLFMFIAAILLIIGSLVPSLVLIVSGIVFTGLAYGGGPTLTSAYSHTFGPQNFTTNFSILSFDMLPAAIIGPMISAQLLERSGGNYSTSFYAILVFTVIALGFWMLLNRASKRSNNEGNR